jgi:hypothetical protein
MYAYRGAWGFTGVNVDTPDVLAVQVGDEGIYEVGTQQLSINDTGNWDATKSAFAVAGGRINLTFYLLALEEELEGDQRYFFSDDSTGAEHTRESRVVAIITCDGAGAITEVNGYNSALEGLGITGIASISVGDV